MPLLNSIFGGCSSIDTKQEAADEIERRLNRLEAKLDIIERDYAMSMKRLEDKLSMKFDILSNKLDNFIMLFSQRN